jgi:hypothetical protein
MLLRKSESPVCTYCVYLHFPHVYVRAVGVVSMAGLCPGPLILFHPHTGHVFIFLSSILIAYSVITLLIIQPCMRT